jgi:antitoxin (DNA-binding transcriptional repressor) of toxin-antitoxin stability system
MPDVYSIAEAAARLDELVRRAAAGEEIILEGSGDKRVRLTEDASALPASGEHGAGKRVFGRLAGQIEIADDFDETPEWLIEAFYHSDSDEELLFAPLREEAHKAGR